MRGLDDYGAECLAAAIVKQAVHDWRSAVKTLKKHPNAGGAEARRLECEYFFLSQYFAALSGMDGHALLEKMEEIEKCE